MPILYYSFKIIELKIQNTVDLYSGVRTDGNLDINKPGKFINDLNKLKLSLSLPGSPLEKVKRSLKKVKRSLEKVKRSLEKVRRSLEKVRRSLEKVSGSLEKVNRSLEKVSTSLKKVSGSLEKVNRSLENTILFAERYIIHQTSSK